MVQGDTWLHRVGVKGGLEDTWLSRVGVKGGLGE